MIRKEALDKAIELASQAEGLAETVAETGRGTLRARLGELWLGIADRLPVEEEMVVEEPFVPPVAEGDEAAVTATCGHQQIVLLSAGHWIHVFGDPRVCDDPPVKGAER